MKLKNPEVGIPTAKHKPRRLGGLVGVILTILAAAAAATQIFAWKYQYAPVLGDNFHHFYAPWKILVWANYWWSDYKNQFRLPLSMAMMVGAIGLIATIFYQIIMNNSSTGVNNLHGSARWAKLKDIRYAGLLPRPRFFGLIKPKKSKAPFVYVGGWVDKNGKTQYLRHAGGEHILTFAPTRSGKGVGLVIPTLLSWTDSAIITDLKGELWALTAGWRKKYANNIVIKFEPAALDSAHWNPLDEIQLNSAHTVAEVQNLATMIVDPTNKGVEGMDHWGKSAFSLVSGVILHALYKQRDSNGEFRATLGTVDQLMSNPENKDNPMALYAEMATNTWGPGGTADPLVAAAGTDMLNRPEEEGGSVVSTAKSFFSLYRDPVIENNISNSNFRMKDLMNLDKPVSLYVVTQPTDKDRVKPLVRILFTMAVRLNADHMNFKKGRPAKDYKHKLLAMLDEFPSLGKLEVIKEGLAFIAGYGIKCYLITQNLKQLTDPEKGYGRDETITANCHIQNAYPPNVQETAEHLSKLTGQTTIMKEQITTSGKRNGFMMSNVSKTYQETARPLLTPDECMRLPGPKKSGDAITEPGDMLIFAAGSPAIYGKQILYFKDPVFEARAEIEAPEKSDIVKGKLQPYMNFSVEEHKLDEKLRQE